MNLDAHVFPQLREGLSYYLNFLCFTPSSPSGILTIPIFILLMKFYKSLSLLFSVLTWLFQNSCPLIYLLSIPLALLCYRCSLLQFSFHSLNSSGPEFVGSFFIYVSLVSISFFVIEWSFWVFLQFIEFLLNRYFEFFISNILKSHVSELSN